MGRRRRRLQKTPNRFREVPFGPLQESSQALHQRGADGLFTAKMQVAWIVTASLFRPPQDGNGDRTIRPGSNLP
jgi:hypothetical protein